MKQIFASLLIALLLTAAFGEHANAQTRKAGINSAAFLKIGVGARQVGIGSAVTSMSGDINNMYWNPAGIAMKDVQMQGSVTYNNWFAGLTQTSIAAGYNLEGIGTVGIGAMTFGISNIPADRDNGFTDPQLVSQQIDAVSSSTYDYRDLLVQGTFARNINDNLSLGVTAKYIHEKIDDKSASAVAFDFGSVYNIGVLGWSLGARLNNLGGDIKYYDFAAPIPLTFSFGTSMTPLTVGKSSFTVALDAVKPQDGQQYYYSGLEWNYDNTLFLRGGWKFNYSWMGLAHDAIDEGTSIRSGIQTSLEKGSLGAGLRMPFEEYMMSFDYAYTIFSVLDGVHRFSLHVSMK